MIDRRPASFLISEGVRHQISMRLFIGSSVLVVQWLRSIPVFDPTAQKNRFQT
jgi:hypothetical protein